MPATTAARRPGRPPGADPRRPERLEAILEAACRAILERGFPATRIADVANAAGVSTGTVHYYFDTRDEVLLAALKWATDRLFARVEEAAGDDPPRRLGHLLEVSVPTPGPARDEYVLWIELWLRVLHQPDLLPGIEGVSRRWREHFSDIVRAGAERGDFDPSPRRTRSPTGSSRSSTDSASRPCSGTAGRRPSACAPACSRSRPSSSGSRPPRSAGRIDDRLGNAAARRRCAASAPTSRARAWTS